MSQYRNTWVDDGGVRPNSAWNSVAQTAGTLVPYELYKNVQEKTVPNPSTFRKAGAPEWLRAMGKNIDRAGMGMIYGDALKTEAGRQAVKNIKGPLGYVKAGIKGTIPRARGVAGIGSLLAILDAAQELRDPTDPTAVNVAEAVGSLGGTAGGTMLGGVVGQTLLPFLPGVGWVVGAGIGGMLGSGAGKGLARGAYSIIDPNVDLNQQLKRQAIQNEINSARLAPMQQLLDQQSARNRQSRQDAILANALANAQSAGASTVNTILSGGY